MSEEWSRYAKILEREDREFRRAMQEEVSTLFPLNLAANAAFWLELILSPSVR